MEAKFKITIPKPCHEDWNSMSSEETGRFCNVCTKTVVDFTKMENHAIKDYFIQNREHKICGKFKNEQVNRFNIQIPNSVLKQRMTFQKAFLLALFIVMGTSLFSCKNHNNDTLGEVTVVEDTVEENNTTLGVALPLKDTVIDENEIMGKIDIKRYDSLVKAGVKMPALPPPPPPKIKQVKFVK